MDTDLEAIFDGDDTALPEPTEEQVEQQPEPEQAEQPEQELEAGTGENEVEVPPTSEPKTVPLAALEDERNKRQQAEQALQEMQASKPKEPEVDFDEDPKGYVDQKAVSAEQQLHNMRIDMSVDMSRKAHEDFDEVMKSWPEIVGQNPSILQQAESSPQPGEFAYEACKQHIALKEIGDPANYRERVKAELLAEIKAEQESKAEEAKKQELVSNNPPSLAGQVSAGSRQGPEWAGPESLDELFGSNA